jgi:hypothetical protein
MIMGQAAAAIKIVAEVVGFVLAAKSAVDTYENRRIAKHQAEDQAVDVQNMLSKQRQDLQVAGLKYKTASAQEVTLGYQNYLRALLKVAPYYVSRYKDDLRTNYVKLVDKREAQAAKDQPILDTIRKHLPKEEPLHERT